MKKLIAMTLFALVSVSSANAFFFGWGRGNGCCWYNYSNYCCPYYGYYGCYCNGCC